MSLVRRTMGLMDISGSGEILRRYLVVNGFDGALTMLGLIMGFLFSAPGELDVALNACIAAAIALGMSGISSAYVSEVAERKRQLEKLEGAMIEDLSETAHGEAARWVPLVVAFVNGVAPLLISLLIISPLWLAREGVPLALPPLYLAILIAFSLIFVLGVLLGRIAEVSWLRSGAQTTLVAAITVALIYVLTS